MHAQVPVRIGPETPAPALESPEAAEAIRSQIKQAIAKVSKIDPAAIGDQAAYREDLGLDSLSILETIVEVQCRFRIPDLPESEFAQIRTVEDTVQFVQQYLRSAGVEACVNGSWSPA
jgi:acyl carrier protein